MIPLKVEFTLKVNEIGKNTMLNISIENLDLRDEELVNSVILSIKEHFEFYKDNKGIQHFKKTNNNEQDTI